VIVKFLLFTSDYCRLVVDFLTIVYTQLFTVEYVGWHQSFNLFVCNMLLIFLQTHQSVVDARYYMLNLRVVFLIDIFGCSL